MALGDGIRRNILSVSQQERDRFRDAIIALNKKLFPSCGDPCRRSNDVLKLWTLHGGGDVT